MRRFFRDATYFLKASIALNAVLAVGKLVAGILTFSIFMCFHAFYNVGMGMAKYFILAGIKRSASRSEEYEVFRTVGIVVLAASLVYALYSVRLFIGGQSARYPQVAAITIATVTFTEIVLNIQGSISTKKADRLMLHANKLVGLASSLVSLVLTQTAIMSFAHDGDAAFANGLSGVFFGICAALIGLYMLLYGSLRRHKEKMSADRYNNR